MGLREAKSISSARSAARSSQQLDQCAQAPDKPAKKKTATARLKKKATAGLIILLQVCWKRAAKVLWTAQEVHRSGRSLSRDIKSFKVVKPNFTIRESVDELTLWAHEEMRAAYLHRQDGCLRWLMRIGMPFARQITKDLKDQSGTG